MKIQMSQADISVQKFTNLLISNLKPDLHNINIHINGEKPLISGNEKTDRHMTDTFFLFLHENMLCVLIRSALPSHF